MVAGDVAMLEREVTPVLKALRANGIDVVAIHHHMTDVQAGRDLPALLRHRSGGADWRAACAPPSTCSASKPIPSAVSVPDAWTSTAVMLCSCADTRRRARHRTGAPPSRRVAGSLSDGRVRIDGADEAGVEPRRRDSTRLRRPTRSEGAAAHRHDHRARAGQRRRRSSSASLRRTADPAGIVSFSVRRDAALDSRGSRADRARARSSTGDPATCSPSIRAARATTA